MGLGNSRAWHQPRHVDFHADHLTLVSTLTTTIVLLDPPSVNTEDEVLSMTEPVPWQECLTKTPSFPHILA